jgi:hypothetical protein
MRSAVHSAEHASRKSSCARALEVGGQSLRGRSYTQGARAQESCQSNGLIQEHIEEREKVDIAELEEAGTWYYVVDCATCKAVIPFKYAPEDEPILQFPTMTVRCFHCHTDHTYAADLISHRKATAPPGIFKKELASSGPGDGDQEAYQDRQEDRGSEGGVLVKRDIDYLSSSLRRANILLGAMSGKRSTIFFLSSCFFAAGWVSQLVLHIFYPVRSSGPAVLLTTEYLGSAIPSFFEIKEAGGVCALSEKNRIVGF